MINKVLFVMNKYDRCHPEWGPSHFTAAIETFKETGFAREVTMFPIDELSQKAGQHVMEEELLQICAGDRPDLIIFVPTGWPHIDPSRNIVSTITTLGIKVHMVRSDSGGAEGHRFTNSWFPFVSSIGFVDMTVAHLGYNDNPKAIQAFPCLSSNYFYDKQLPQDIDVSFVGSIGNWLHRGEYIQFLREHGINIVTQGGGEFDTRLTTEEYSNIISRSKISLNFCLYRTGGYSQIKGRVLDILGCRSCMVEDEGTETGEFLEEGKDFIMVRSKEEVPDKVLYYLEHDGERERVAESGYKKVTELYNARNLWAHILAKLGFNLPDNIARDKHYRELSRKLDLIREVR